MGLYVHRHRRGGLSYALQYSKQREQFGQPIFNFQLIQDKLVTMLVEIEAAKLLTYKGLTCCGSGQIQRGPHARRPGQALRLVR